MLGICLISSLAPSPGLSLVWRRGLRRAFLRQLFASLGLVVIVAGPAPTGAEPDELRLLAIESLEDLPREERPQAYEAAVLAVRQAYGAQDYRRAREIAERMALYFGQFHRPWVHLAAINLQLEQFDNAQLAAERARDRLVDPLPPELIREEQVAASHYWEGLVWYKRQRYTEALEHFDRALEALPQWPEAARAAGEAAFVAQDYQTAARLYEQAFSSDANIGDDEDYAYYAEALKSLGETGTAIAALEAALRRYPYSPGLHANLGDMLRREGNLTEAYYHFSMEPLLHGMRSLFAQRSLEAVQEILDEIQAAENSAHRHELSLVTNGLAELRDEAFHKAIHFFEHAQSITKTTTPMPRLLLAQAHLKHGDLELAKAMLVDYLSFEPEFVPALVLLSEAQRALGELEASEATLEKAYEIFPGYWKLNREELRG